MSCLSKTWRYTKKRPPFPLLTQTCHDPKDKKDDRKGDRKYNRCYCCRKVDKIGRGCSPMKAKRARRGRAFDRMPCGVVMTSFSKHCKGANSFWNGKRFRLLFCRRSHFDNECHSECAFLAAFWPYSNGLSLNVLRGSPRLSPAKRLPFWTCFGRVLDVFDKKPPTFGGKWGAFWEKVWG